MHINMIKGDYVYRSWDKESGIKMNKKMKELESLGFKMVNETMDFLNIYYHYKNEQGEEVIITGMCP